METYRRNTTLTTFDIPYNKIGSEGAKMISDMLKERKAPPLESLNLYWNEIGLDGSKELVETLCSQGSAAHPFHLGLGMNSVGPESAILIAEMMKEKDNILTLNLTNCKIGDEGGMAIAQALRSTKRFTLLNIDNAGLRDQPIIAIAEAFIDNPTITYACARGNDITGMGTSACIKANLNSGGRVFSQRS